MHILPHVFYELVDPAHAGMILGFPLGELPSWGGPRACGDDPATRVRLDHGVAWTPRMRG